MVQGWETRKWTMGAGVGGNKNKRAMTLEGGGCR